MSGFVLAGARVFDGEALRTGLAVHVAKGRIVALQPEREVSPTLETHRIDGLLVPGFIDVQVNGGGGVLFNDRRSVAGIRAIGAAHRRFGTTGFLPTFITDTRERMAEAVEAVRQGLAERVPGLLGIHLEGPFINPARRGVHDPQHIRPMEDADRRILSASTGGRTLVTLAPEMVEAEAIGALAAAGIIVAAGHTEADLAMLDEARRLGMTGYTHLFNAMPPLAGRQPGPVGAALAERASWCGLIVDRHHVSATSLRVALAARGGERLLLVTDAMPSVGSDLSGFDLLGTRISRAGGKLTTPDGTLAGSDLDMASAVRNAVRWLGVRLEDALRMASLEPAAFLGLDTKLGRIAPGYGASLVLLDDDLAVTRTWIDGIESRPA